VDERCGLGDVYRSLTVCTTDLGLCVIRLSFVSRAGYSGRLEGQYESEESGGLAWLWG
jgi:hypothetical protein